MPVIRIIYCTPIGHNLLTTCILTPFYLLSIIMSILTVIPIFWCYSFIHRNRVSVFYMENLKSFSFAFFCFVICRNVILRMIRRACITLLRVWWLCRHCMELSHRSLAKENVQGWEGQHCFCPFKSLMVTTCSHAACYINTGIAGLKRSWSVWGYNDVSNVETSMSQMFIRIREPNLTLNPSWTGFCSSADKCLWMYL